MRLEAGRVIPDRTSEALSLVYALDPDGERLHGQTDTFQGRAHGVAMNGMGFSVSDTTAAIEGLKGLS